MRGPAETEKEASPIDDNERAKLFQRYIAFKEHARQESIEEVDLLFCIAEITTAIDNVYFAIGRLEKRR